MDRQFLMQLEKEISINFDRAKFITLQANYEM